MANELRFQAFWTRVVSSSVVCVLTHPVTEFDRNAQIPAIRQRLGELVNSTRSTRSRVGPCTGGVCQKASVGANRMRRIPPVHRINLEGVLRVEKQPRGLSQKRKVAILTQALASRRMTSELHSPGPRSAAGLLIRWRSSVTRKPPFPSRRASAANSFGSVAWIAAKASALIEIVTIRDDSPLLRLRGHVLNVLCFDLVERLMRNFME
jgi:hypothetical protein